MKAMLTINENPDLIRGRIQSIRAINIHEAEEVTAPLAILQDNYNRLKATYLDLDIPTLKTGIFMNDVNAHVFRAYDWLHSFQAGSNIDFLELNTMDKSVVQQYTRNEILKIIKNFLGQHNITSFADIGGKNE
jgi:hypothetical protein